VENMFRGGKKTQKRKVRGKGGPQGGTLGRDGPFFNKFIGMVQ